ncbi:MULTISPECIES: glycosyltransferase family 4 protein [Weeksella]|uniref:TPR/glycosyl transferase domain protein n=1 Tax=Weeksella virosa (strain ATCC 43766 / DSM 16922 / JCM 21250 / CCUG 30538 / CDC 9751 / IAM 14551 / NBRC 16016 / NCTC 11634 / CL345/78) TaxID=865938 RepID=F0NYB1_WEEVC|nr:MULTISPECIES: glycosyltransferase family 4 protein [Weeksella]ADX68108.1 TPR/glycosyl transferase domain protein [Weeksella virosa DSM 16922]MDK7374909.1 glycosyltransferase family 4 protein [Weeksella virosa]MDK7675448.1 glycosyltransferase family 4 protein [Weeksella virosa]OFM83896.1 glycosyl transferase family 1 [Weeksella sp. HMSC059D05]SUP54419.1 Uncharacterised protein [Weeksella virosa]
MAKKVLIVSYYWPPSGGPGVQRWLKFTKYLPELGYETYVYTPKNPSYPIIDESLEREINPKVKIIHTTIWEPYQLAEKLNPKNKAYKAGHFEQKEQQSFLSKLSVFVRGNFFIPDARFFWVRPSIQFLTKYIEEEKIDILITTGPPHSMHLIGLGLKKRLDHLHWIADFRDPWTDISYHKELKLTNWAAKKHRNLEKEVIQKADVLLATSYTDGENFRQLGARKVEVITNGFEDVKQVSSKDSHFFELTYSGGLEMLRNPLVVWEALAELMKEDKSFAQNLRINFYGALAEDVLQTITENGLEKNVFVHGYVAHKTAIEAINKANILLMSNFDNPASRGIIPGKLFEYMATENPILAIGPTDSDVEKILIQTQTGKYFSYREKEKIKQFIRRLYLQWLNNPRVQLPINKTEVEKFSRKNLTKKLVYLMDNMLKNSYEQ